MQKNQKIPFLRIGLGILFFILILGPILILLSRAVYSNGQLNLTQSFTVLLDSENVNTIANSLLLGFLVVVVSTILAFPIAFLLAKTEFSKHRWLDIILMVPFMTPPYIASMGWILFMQKRGLLQQLIPQITGSHRWFFSLAGLVIVMTFSNFPFMVNMMREALSNVPHSLEESAAVFGAPLHQRIKKILFPLIRANYAIAALLIFVRTISEYGAPATIGARFGFEVFTTSIHRNATVAPVSFENASILSILLMVICFLVWWVQSKITRKSQYNLVGSRSNRTGTMKLSLIKKLFSWIYLLIIFLVSIGIPYFSVIMTSLIKRRGRGLQSGNFTMDHYIHLFTDNQRALNALGNSFVLATVSACLCVLIGTLLVTVIRKKEKRMDYILEFTALIPQMLPGIVIVLGLMIFWNTVYQTLPVYNTMGMLLITYVALFIPYTINYVNSAYNQIGENIVEAGKIYGASTLQIFIRIHLPLLARSIILAWMMSFIIGLRELVGSSMVSPPGQYVISTFIMREFEQGSVSIGMAMATITVVLTILILLVLYQLIHRLKNE